MVKANEVRKILETYYETNNGQKEMTLGNKWIE